MPTMTIRAIPMLACLFIIVTGACSARKTRTVPSPTGEDPEPAVEAKGANLILFGQYHLPITAEGWPEAYVKGRALFEEGEALHGKDDFAGAADRFLRAAEAYASFPSTHPHTGLVRKNHDLSCANARVAFLNGGLKAELERAADRLAATDPECVKHLSK